MHHRFNLSCLLLCAVSAPAFSATGQLSPTLNWADQYGTSTRESVGGVGVDPATGNIFITGTSEGALDGSPDLYRWNAFVSMYSPTGIRLWTRQFAPSYAGPLGDAAVDWQGNALLTGTAGSALPGQTQIGQDDGYLVKYDTAGNQLWATQFGTGAHDRMTGIATDAQTPNAPIYVSGSSNSNLVLTSFDSNGVQSWTTTIATGTDGEFSRVALAPDGNIVVTGATSNGAVTSKVTPAGAVLWTQTLQPGPGVLTRGEAIDVDSLGNIYISGETRDAFPGESFGGIDSFVAKYDAAGTFQWVTQGFGANGTALDRSRGVAVIDDDTLVVFGETQGKSFDQTNAGGYDVYFVGFDSSGNPIWHEQLGSPSGDEAYDLAYDGQDGLIAVGFTGGDLIGGATPAGDRDVFIINYTVPEPGAAAIMIGLIPMVLRRRRR